MAEQISPALPTFLISLDNKMNEKRIVTPETRAKISATLRGRKLGPHSPEHRAKIAAACSRRSKKKTWAQNGYVRVYRPDHPFAHQRGWILEHRLVMEGILGRYLTSGETVHHRNGVRNDNRPENLEVVVTRGPHYGGVICPYCEKHFLIR